MTFALDLKAFVEKAKANADQAVGIIVANVAAEVDKRSPVGDAVYWKSPPPKGYIGGHFRANWRLGIGSPERGEVAGVDPDGKATLGAIQAAIPQQAAGRVYYISNNAPYALRLENGWSRQAPAGVVGLTATMFQEIVNASVAEVRS